MSNYYNKTLPNFAPVGYDEWLKQQNAKKNSGSSGTSGSSLNSNTFKDSTSNDIRESAEKAAAKNVAKSVDNGNYLFYDNLIPQGMIDGFAEHQHEQIVKELKSENQGSVVTGGMPLAGFSPLLDNVAKETVKDGETIADLVGAVSAITANERSETKPETNANEQEKAVADNIAPIDSEVTNNDFNYPNFAASEAYTQAMEYTNSLLSQINSGRTSYTDQIDSLLKEFQNRDKFSYDMNNDPLFQQMLAASMNSGKMAMNDTIGQAAALTGGYGNTYGQAVGNAAYNQYIADSYGNLPDYYNLALDAYNTEGDRMLSELAMLRDADSVEYNRLVDAYSASLDVANAMYDREYAEYLNGRNFAYDNYWNEKEFNYGAYMDALNQSNTDRDFNYGVEMDKQAQENWERQFDYKAEQDEMDRQYQMAQDAFAALGGANETESYKEPTQTMYTKAMEAYATGGDAALIQYLETIPNYSVEDIDAYIGKYGVIETPELKTYTKTKDTKNGFGGVDRNDVVEDQYGNQYKLSELPAEVAKILTDLKKGESYNFSTGKKVK